MNEFKDIIVNLVSETLLVDLPDNQEYISLCETYKNNILFNSFCKKVEKEKGRFEKTVLLQDNPKSMLCEALKLLNQRKENPLNEDFTIQKRFIEKLVLPHCNGQQQECYEARLCYFEDCSIDYFFSFTSRKPNPRENNMIHRNHKFFIKDVFFWDKPTFEREIKKAEQSNTNLLARAINHLIAQKLNGFYYPYHQGDNDIVMRKLTEGCTSAFAFIQLIQNIIFEYDPHRPNYCHFEYKTIQDSIEKDRRFFILAERNRGDIRGVATLHPEYEEWHTDYHGKDPLHLLFSDEYRSNELKETKKLIEVEIADRIKNMRQRLLEDVPY